MEVEKLMVFNNLQDRIIQLEDYPVFLAKICDKRSGSCIPTRKYLYILCLELYIGIINEY